MPATLVTASPAPVRSSPRTFSLDQVKIASPCPKQWSDMSPVDGSGDRVRHCGECNLNVYNLSNMTRDEAAALFEAHDGSSRMCAGFYRRADGTILVRDCPVGERALRRKAVAAWARVGAAAAVLVSATLAMGARRGLWSPRLTDLNPFALVRQAIQPGWKPASPAMYLGGVVCVPPAPAPSAPATAQGN